MKLGEEIFQKFAKNMEGKTVRVLIEKTSSENHFSGWSENYLFCNETNIELLPNQEIARGKVVEGIYMKAINQKTGDE